MFKTFSRYRDWRRNRTPRQLTRRQRKILLTAQIAFVLVLVIVALFTVGRVFIQLARPIPTTVDGVLSSTFVPDTYRYETQIVRRYSYNGDVSEQHRVQGFSVDEKRGMFQGGVLGVLERPINLASDGTRTIRYIENADLGYQEIDKIPVSQVAPFTAKDIMEADPSILDANETEPSARVQAWLIGFTPTKEMLSKLLMVDALQLEDLELTADDIKAIQEGDVTVEYAHAWITRIDRLLLRTDIKFQIGEDGPEYRVMTTWNDIGHNDFENFTIEQEEG